MVYICIFVFKGEIYYTYSDRGIHVFREGFWVNENLNLTDSLDMKYWIPPHKINYIEKYEERE